MKKILKERKGITLIALVITIIVLLILAGVSIAMLTGENGILKQASNAQIKTKQAEVEEMVSLAIESLQIKNLGDTSKITPQMIAEQVNQENDRSDVSAEKSSFPTNILFEKDGLQVPGNSTIFEEIPIYSVEVEESDIAPQEIFKIETEDGKVASINDDVVLPTKTAKITGIKEEYCNHREGEEGDTNYEINYNGTKINDLLIIPYRVEVDGEWYVVSEVSLEVTWHAKGFVATSSLPQVNTIIYPNTVEKIVCATSGDYNDGGVPETGGPKEVILPRNITEIPAKMFNGYNNIEITISNNVTKIREYAFGDVPFGESVNDNNIVIVNYQGTKEEWGKIEIVDNENERLEKARIVCTDGVIENNE